MVTVATGAAAMCPYACGIRSDTLYYRLLPGACNRVFATQEFVDLLGNGFKHFLSEVDHRTYSYSRGAEQGACNRYRVRQCRSDGYPLVIVLIGEARST